MWQFDSSEPLVTPERLVESMRNRLGVTADQHRLPPTLIATFQRGAFERLMARTGVRDTPPDHGAGSGALRRDYAIGELGGSALAISQFGLGAPAAALALEEAIVRGVRNVIVVGSAGSLQPELPIGSTVVVEGAEREDGTSHHYLPAGEVVRANEELTNLLESCAAARGAVPQRGRSWTIDAPYRETTGAIRRHRENGVAVVEMEAAALFAVSQVRQIRAGLIVAVSDELFDVWDPGFGHRAFLEALMRAADAAIDVASKIARMG